MSGGRNGPEQGETKATEEGKSNSTPQGSISPRFDVYLKGLQKWQDNLLPSCRLDLLALMTSASIMAARKQDKNRRENPKILFLGVQYTQTNF